VSTPDDAEFNSIIEFQKAQSMNPQQEYTDNAPYGTQMHSGKPGLTKRGKAALGIGAAVIAGGSLIGYQSYAANAAENEAKAQELAIKSQQLELAKMRELNRSNQADRKAQVSETETRQASINKCVKDQADQVGKEYGSPSYRDVVDACQAQYADTTSSADDMQTAASSSQVSSGDEGGVNNFLLLGGGALAVLLVTVAKNGKRSNPA
jgi:hypothetical protein